jgi:hypothetical protein
MTAPVDLAPRGDDARPIMGFRVGVTGHRTLDAAAIAEIERAVAGVLGDIERSLAELRRSDAARELYADPAPILRLVSPLAEGADRLVARAALDRGWRLSAPLPFPRAEYERDFPDSVAEFRAFLDRAAEGRQVLELDGSRARESEAYLQVGHFVIDHSDLIIAVWNGEKAAGEGGTGQIVDEALLRSIPVVHVSSRAPHPIRLLDGSDEPGPYSLAALKPHIACLILPAWEAGKRAHDRAAAVYLRGERVVTTATAPDFLYRGPFRVSLPWPISWLAPVFPKFLLLLGGRPKSTEAVVAAPPPAGADHPILRMLFLHFQRADALATRYSEIHRSAFVLIYAFGSLSLAAAATAQYLQDADILPHLVTTFAVAVELFGLIGVLLAYLAGRRLRWRERWLDYRLLAEILREIDLLAQIGGAPLAGSLDRVNDIHPERGWVAWFVAAVARSIGIVGGRYDDRYLRTVRDYAVETRLADQIDYHQRTGRRSAAISKRLRLLSQGMFALTIAAILLELELSRSMVWPFAASLFPAIAAASFGIRNQAEFEIVVSRSERLGTRLVAESARIKAIDPNRLTSARLGRAIRRAALVMQADAVEWAAIFEVKESDVA